MPLTPVLRVGATQAVNGAEIVPLTNPATGAASTINTLTVTAEGNGVSQASYLPGTPGPVAPAVPASTVNATNSNAYPVSVVVTGGTLTAVVVNGVTVGTTAGTYTVPVGGTISITYTVAPTWAWFNALSLPGLVNGNTTYTPGQAVPVATVVSS